MKRRYCVFTGMLLLCFCSNVSGQFPSSRDVYQWPFSQGSIWNMPIGSNAVYVPANLHLATQQGMFIDEDILVLNSTAPLINIYYSSAAWTVANRCIGDPFIMLTAPIPPNFIVSPQNWTGLTPNSCLAALMPDGVTLKQSQPFAKCEVGPSATTYVYSTSNDVNIYGDGILGAHGGSGLSSIGGTLRKDELLSPDDTIRHVLKVNVYAQLNLSYSPANLGYRWPAVKADDNAATLYGSAPGANPAPQCRMGALLAIPVSMNLYNMGFETVPGKILARAFQTYGAYIVDNAGWNVYAIATEWSPQGRFKDNFQSAWGFPFDIQSLDTPWARDMNRIFMNLYVVDNNTPFSIGGGGTPLAPLAPPFTVDIDDIHKPPKFSVYPNPTFGIFNITPVDPGNASFKVRITDPYGQEVLYHAVLGRDDIFDLGDAKPGIYTLSILGSEETNSFKIIKLN